MFTTAQETYIEAMLPTYAKEGYKYYVCYTNTMVNNSYYTPTDPDLYILFSKETISAEDAYHYDYEDASVLVAIRSVNYSSGSSAVNTDRITSEVLTAGTLVINPYEHIYSNAEISGTTIVPDKSLGTVGETNVQVKSISFIILAVVLFIALRSLWFTSRGGRL